jgi:hypothetical protein
MKRINVFLLAGLIVFGACSPTPVAVVPLPTYTMYPTLAPLPTYTPYPTLAPLPTYTPYPRPTEKPTATVPAITDTPEPTANSALTNDKAEGVWLVSKEVAAGLWRASGDCYAVTEDKAGEQMDMASGPSSIIAIPSDAFSVKFVSYPGHCTWSYLGQ